MNHIVNANKMIGDTPRTEAEVNRPHGPLDGIVTVDANFAAQLERELNAANSKIEALNRGNAAAEKILCELTGCESGRDVPDWIVSAKERIKLLEHGIAKQNLEIEQTCGKALDYPWFKDDQKNFPGATEKDGVCVGEHVAETIAAELARKYTEAKERIKRLEEAGDELQADKQTLLGLLHQMGAKPERLGGVGVGSTNRWINCKEAKP